MRLTDLPPTPETQARYDAALKAHLDRFLPSEKIIFEELEKDGLAREGAAVMKYRAGCPFVVIRATNPAEQPAFEDAYFRAMMRIASAGVPFRHCTPATLDSLVEAQRRADEDDVGKTFSVPTCWAAASGWRL